jgi:hypothetical protein
MSAIFGYEAPALYAGACFAIARTMNTPTIVADVALRHFVLARARKVFVSNAIIFESPE